MAPLELVSQVNTIGGSNRGTPNLEQPKAADETAQKLRTLRKASSDFESIFISRLMEPMINSISKTSSGEQYGGGVMLNVAAEKMAESIAGKRGLGLGDVLFKSLKERLLKDAPPIVEPTKQGPQILESTERKIELLKSNSAIGIAVTRPQVD